MRRLMLLLSLTLLTGSLALAKEPKTELDSDRLPKTRTGGSCVLINGIFLTATGRTVVGEMLIRDGIIVTLGAKSARPEGVKVIDLKGQYVMPGVIDCHSHIAIQGGVNEMNDTITAEVRIGDSVNHRDVSIYRALAGGTTTANLLHGSANPIGGQNAVIKLRYGKSAREMRYKRAPRGIKFALGENVVRGSHFPSTRMGVEATMRRAFLAARAYRASWKTYEKKVASGKLAYPPRRDLRLETLVGVLEGRIRVHCHCYRADEIQMIMRVADEFGFKISTLQHVLEGYKVTPELLRHGAGASTFSDWWGYKVEAYDAIPYNAAYMLRAGVLTSINSDSADTIRRLPLEAAKSMRYGDLTVNEALTLITINPAKQLGIDKWVGSLEVGKQADLAVFNGHPFDVRSHTTMTLIEGEVYFERAFAASPHKSRIPERRGRMKLPGKSALYAIVGATIHPVVGPTIARGVVVVKANRIVAVGGPKTPIPAGALTVDARGLHLYPGMINAWTQVGLTEIGSLDETQDHRDRGQLKPDLLAITAVNPESAHIEVTRSGGITLALTAPSGGQIPGQAALLQLTGWTPSEMALVPRLGLILNFPYTSKKSKKKSAKLKSLEEFLTNTRHYRDLLASAKAGKIPAVRRQSKYEAMLPYVRGEKPVLIVAARKATIEAAVAFADKQKLKIIIVGGREAARCAKLLASKKIPVIYTAVYNTPSRSYEPYDINYRTAGLLAKAGVRFAIASGGASNARNLPFAAGMAWSHGLSGKAALAAVTIEPARILGIDKLVGSIEVGKRADLMLTTGNPLQIWNQVTGLFINGKPISLENRHTRLYEKYLRRLK